jgi:hypothetical protein
VQLACSLELASMLPFLQCFLFLFFLVFLFPFVAVVAQAVNGNPG